MNKVSVRRLSWVPQQVPVYTKRTVTVFNASNPKGAKSVWRSNVNRKLDAFGKSDRLSVWWAK